MQSDYTLCKLFYTMLTLIQFKGHSSVTFGSGYYIFSDFDLNFGLIALCKTKTSCYTALKTVIEVKPASRVKLGLSSPTLSITPEDSNPNADYKSDSNYTEAQP